MNARTAADHVLRIFVHHLQSERRCSNIGNERARRGERRLQLSDVGDVQQISPTELLIGQQLARGREIDGKCRQLTVPLRLCHGSAAVFVLLRDRAVWRRLFGGVSC